MQRTHLPVPDSEEGQKRELLRHTAQLYGWPDERLVIDSIGLVSKIIRLYSNCGGGVAGVWREDVPLGHKMVFDVR